MERRSTFNASGTLLWGRMKEANKGMKSQDTKEATVRALDKALTILGTLSKTDEEIDLATLAKKTRIPKSTLLRLIHTLKRHHFIHQNHKSQKYQIGWAFVYLGKIASERFTLPDIVHPFLEELAVRTGETVSLVVSEGSHGVYIDQVVSSSMIKGIPSIGSRLGLYCTSAGKVLLSAFEEVEFGDYLRNALLEKKTGKTITDPTELKEEIRRVKRQGYAVDDEETESGGRCVAAPVLDKESKIVAAISVLGPASRIRKEDFGSLSLLVKEAAAKASAALGYEARDAV
jgi:IclR family KDG regulon transcriptional repressor